MAFLSKDLSAWLEVCGRLNLEAPPVAVSFMIKRPDGIRRLEDKMFFCQMLKKAQKGDIFYADHENHTCDAALYLLGKDVPPAYHSGEYGAGLQIFSHPRAAKRVYDYLPRLKPGNIDYVAFSALDRLMFEPDLMVVLADVNQTEILLRAMSYTSGKMWTSRFTPFMGCAWILIYPYLTGELNYSLTGLGFGMKALKVFRPGLQLISIPYDLFTTMLQNLQAMPIVLPIFQPNGEEFRRKLRAELGLDPGR